MAAETSIALSRKAFQSTVSAIVSLTTPVLNAFRTAFSCAARARPKQANQPAEAARCHCNVIL